MFIGEAPGWHEDQQGRPFVGQAGQFLDKLLNSINLSREQVYIANVIKCRPPQNRDPLPTEIRNCRPWLDRQIELISPKIIVTLGRYSMSMFFPGKTISKIHGTAQKQGNIIYFAMYHPAAALHQQSLRREIEADMLKIPPLLAQAENVRETPPEPKQLPMFEV
jgi:DNA polymerase